MKEKIIKSLSPEMKAFGMWILNVSNSAATKGHRYKMMTKEDAEDLVEFLYKDFKSKEKK